MHVAIVNWLKKTNVENIETRFMSVQAKKDIQIKAAAATTRMFRTLYAGIRADVSFYQHKIIVLLQKIHGVDLG